ncbi:hypothetical protein JCM11251_004533 [Rhodosporidiobolus azoricus]
MALAPRTATLFVLDCSASMDRMRSFVVGDQKAEVSGLAVAKQYAKAKVVQRIMRDLKTIPFALILLGHEKTKNVLTTRAKERAQEREEKFDRSNDPYRHCYELLPLTFTMDKSLLERIDTAHGAGLETDAFSGLILGIETLDMHPQIAKYATKEIVLITDGENEIDWDGLGSTVRQMNAKGMSLTVVGMDFDDEELGYVEENKSDIKRENEAKFQELVENLEQPSIVANARRAISAITTPQIKTTNSRADRMTLTLGDPTTYADSSLSMYIDVKKAIVPAAAPTMKKMSMRGFERAARTQAAAAASQSQSQSQAHRGTKRPAPADLDGDGTDEDDLDNLKRQARFAEKQNREKQAQMLAGEDIEMGKIGTTFDKTLRNEGLVIGDDEDADIATHNVLQERRYFYRPPDKYVDPNKPPKSAQVTVKKKKQAVNGEEEEGEEDEDGEDEWREAVDAELVDAYHYGGSLVPIGDLEEDVGTLAGLKTGMEIVSFMKESDIRYDWRMGDVFYVYAAPGQLGSEKLFSSLVNGMNEKRSVAITRFVKKGFNSSKLGRMKIPDPQMGILFPQLDEDGLEYCYWCRLPYAEDIRAFSFASLDRLFNRKGERLSEHKLLPTAEQENAMDAFVDSMDMTTAGPPDEEGEPSDWFTIADSYSPAIHNIQNTLVFRLSNPEAPLPPVPRILTKYMDPPQTLVEAATPARERAIKAFDVKLVPPKPRKINKATANYVQNEDIIDTDAIFSTQDAQRINAEKVSIAPPVKHEDIKMDVDDEKGVASKKMPRSTTPDDDEDFVMVEQPKREEAAKVDPEEEEEDEPDTEDEEPATEDEEDGEEGSSEPLTIENAFKEAEQLIKSSFSTSNYKQAVDLLNEAKQKAVKTNSSDSYNASLHAFIDKIRSQPKKVDFLKHMQKGGIGLIGASSEEEKRFAEALA